MKNWKTQLFSSKFPDYFHIYYCSMLFDGIEFVGWFDFDSKIVNTLSMVFLSVNCNVQFLFGALLRSKSFKSRNTFVCICMLQRNLCHDFLALFKHVLTPSLPPLWCVFGLTSFIKTNFDSCTKSFWCLKKCDSCHFGAQVKSKFIRCYAKPI